MPQLEIFLPDDSRSTHDLSDEKVTIGRLPDNVLVIEDGSVSSHHAEIVFEGEKHHIHDLGSTNGTYVNGEQVADAVLNHGDEIRFGQIQCVYSGDEADANAQPLPESSTATAEVAKSSARPAQFVSTSPTPKNVEAKDPVKVALFAFAAVAVLAAVAAAGLVFTMQV